MEITSDMILGQDYIVCLECGSPCGMMGDRHLKSCSGITRAEYKIRHPEAPLRCDSVAQKQKRTEDQKKRHSEVMSEMLKGPLGESVRKQLASMTQEPEVRKRRSERMTEIWKTSAHREKISDWIRNNPEQVKANCAVAIAAIVASGAAEHMRRAREHLNTTSKTHLQFKEKMLEFGLSGFVTEGVLGPFHVDELHGQSKLAVEIDGCYWHGCEECGEQGVGRTIWNDKVKNSYLKTFGYKLLRIRACRIKKDLQGCLESIRDALNQEELCA